MSHLIKTEAEIEHIIHSGKILASVLREIKKKVQPGVSLIELDRQAENFICLQGARPAFLGYKPDGAEHPYPNTICASVNDVVVHGIPSGQVLHDGDIVTIDIGVNWRGGFSDAAITVPVGNVSQEAKRLLVITKDALSAGIQAARGGNTLGDIGYAIESTARRGHAYVIKGLTGHGVGLAVHEEPTVFNYGTPGAGMVLRSGMVLALEPMTSFGTSHVMQKRDDSYATIDGSISAHFEHTIIITDGESFVVTE
ncbi:MAG: type I methionyl aminopeptidase [bacterium]